MSNMNIISKKTVKTIIDSVMNDFFISIKDINILFPKDFIGHYEDLMLKRERLANKLKIKFILPFMPLNYYDKNN